MREAFVLFAIGAASAGHPGWYTTHHTHPLSSCSSKCAEYGLVADATMASTISASGGACQVECV